MPASPSQSRRRGGRPKQFDQVVSLRLPADLHDDLISLARTRDVDVVDVSVVMRAALRHGVLYLKTHGVT